jgi:hypothetical protein
MATYILTDLASDLWVEHFAIDQQGLGLPPGVRCSITKQRLRGGRRDGVDLIRVDNGNLAFTVVPTRGMGIWKAQCGGDRLGWDSPVQDGPVHPAFVNLAAQGGLGWLDGFDELLARCGLAWNGAPFTEGTALYGLHGRIANLPASYVAIHVSQDPPHEIVVEGRVEESHLFGPGIQLITRITTYPGQRGLVVRDEFVNLKDQPIDFQILYHWNFGPPFLEPGARFLAPVKTVTPRDRRAAEGIDRYGEFDGPSPGTTEQVYFFELLPGLVDPARTLAMLCNRAGDRAVVLEFRLDQLPCFTLWKNTGGSRDGYVTGLEPGTNYPNPRSFEKARGRVPSLEVNGRRVVETRLTVVTGEAAVRAVEGEIGRTQSQALAVVHQYPTEPFTAAG